MENNDIVVKTEQSGFSVHSIYSDNPNSESLKKTILECIHYEKELDTPQKKCYT